MEQANENEIQLSEDQEEILKKLLKNPGVVFLTGRAGTGKTTLIREFKRRYKKSFHVLAPTGIAALNIEGSTIHRFFKFPKNLNDTTFTAIGKRDEVYMMLDCLIIDEVSMVRCDTLDFIDKFLREAKKVDAAFGGVKMILVGDLYQLPPVVDQREREHFRGEYDNELFFSAKALKETEYKIYELTNIYRQKDIEFINILNAIRNNTADDTTLFKLNTRIRSSDDKAEDKFSITLCSKRKVASGINIDMLEQLPGDFISINAIISGKVEPEDYPTSRTLSLKIGSQVMLIKNSRGRRWINGSMGKVVGFIEASEEEYDDEVLNEYDNSFTVNSPLLVQVELKDGRIVDVGLETWDIFEPGYNKSKKKIEHKVVGHFTQYPLILAWAISIHRSQGQTLENVNLELKGGLFAPGQLYVGLSRCTSLNGLVLRQEIEHKHIRVNWRVTKYFINYYINQAEKLLSYEAKKEIILKCIDKAQKINIKYINKSNEISIRTLTPRKYYRAEFKGNAYMALDAFDSVRQEIRTFQISRILNINNLEEVSLAIDL